MKFLIAVMILTIFLIAGCTQTENVASLNNTQAICTAASCQKLGYNCGNWSDECGGTLNCGVCAINQKCNNGICSCNPETCSSLGKDCGRWDNGCNQTIDCGNCSSIQICNYNGQCLHVNACSDGTLYNQCSSNKPYYCDFGALISKCSECGCPSGNVCISDSCYPNPSTQNCSDDTHYSQCSTTKPKYCDNGNLIDKCSVCGCNSNELCQANETCASRPSVVITALPFIASINAYPSNPYFVNPYLANFTVANIGNKTATVNFNINGSISSFSTLSATDATLIPVQSTIEGIMSGGFNLTVSINIPTSEQASYNGSLNIIQNGNILLSVPIFLNVWLT